MSEIIIIKLGGSVISTKDITFNFEYLRNLRVILEEGISIGNKYCLVLGGGYTMRMYRDLAKNEGEIEAQKELHWIGTTVNVLHAEITRAFFSDIAAERPIIYEDYYSKEKLKLDKPILVGGGGRAGHSGDVDAILLAEKVGAKQIITLKNIDFLYSADPKVDPNATRVERATWNEYFDIIGWKDTHEPGGNYIVDPVASKMASEKGLSFAIINGENLENLKNLLNGKEFVGSIIS